MPGAPRIAAPAFRPAAIGYVGRGSARRRNCHSCRPSVPSPPLLVTARSVSNAWPRAVPILQSTMPAAVAAHMIAQRHGVDPQSVARLVIASADMSVDAAAAVAAILVEWL